MVSDRDRARLSFQIEAKSEQSKTVTPKLEVSAASTAVMPLDTIDPTPSTTNVLAPAQNKRLWLALTVSSISAVITGIVFGLLILSLIDSPNNSVTSDTEASATQQKKVPTPIAKSTNVIVPAFESQVIQTGVFSTIENAKAAASQVADKLNEQPIVYRVSEGNFLVLLGMYTTKQEAIRDQKAYLKSGMETMVKPMKWPAYTANELGPEQSKYLNSISEARELATHLLAFEKSKVVSTAHREWLNESLKIQPSPNQAQVNLNQHLNNAHLAWLEYQNRDHLTYRRSVQSNVLRYFVAEKSLINLNEQ